MSPVKMILLLFSMCVAYAAQSQRVQVSVSMQPSGSQAQKDTIFYDARRKLTWNDFKGAPPPQARWGAMTASGFSFNSSMEDDGSLLTVNIVVYTFFIPHESWKRSDIHSAYHLEHEQGHFDITYIGACRLVAELKKARFTTANYQQRINAVFDKVYNENLALQALYDKETGHSLLTAAQQEWNKKIAELKENAAQQL